MVLKSFGRFHHSAESRDDHGEDEELIIGLDFGTTFSGIAYAFLKSSKIYFSSWIGLVSINQTKVKGLRQLPVSPGLEGYHQPKTLTVISYDPKDKNSFA